ncbi:Stp1/IreP family PP2C-type Ser/Thr phosphatase [uncultured Olegusella sp.]|uniref:Stp1/IreP family PP2C-type Ser/Thr phosphatase n=1 Tax=uncultured Olegusella sp. TaxID=1979846 RepID=UPI00260F3209|nr:Stp1/IreP family PP2C-type Ser/Thr phosphatase [uncultured Olegusella sp.]
MTSPGHDTLCLDSREDSQTATGSTTRLSWGVRSDVGLVRDHNEDSFLIRAPLFAVCDGMGGHAAGEVASSIAAQTLAEQAPHEADDVYLGATVEAANLAIINATKEGKGKPGMGSTCTSVIIIGDKMAIAHVGDSRLYLLHAGTLVRLTHDHSYVEELVDAGEITADEARVHPSRSVITRALGSDPEMYADHFTINVSTGDRLILCSDGLSSMIEDAKIESVAVSCATPQSAADSLVAEALSAGGHDNVTVLVVDIEDDGLEEARWTKKKRHALRVTACILGFVLLMLASMTLIIRSSYFLKDHNGRIAIYRGWNDYAFGLPLNEWVETSDVQTSEIADEATRTRLEHEGVAAESYKDAYAKINAYMESTTKTLDQTAETKEKVEQEGISPDNPAVPLGEDSKTSSANTSEAGE